MVKRFTVSGKYYTFGIFSYKEHFVLESFDTMEECIQWAIKNMLGTWRILEGNKEIYAWMN